MTESNFKINLGFLLNYFRFKLTPEYWSLYWKMLKHLSDEKFEVACKNIIKEFLPTNSVPFPLVTTFLRMCGDAGDNQAIAAITKLKRAIGKIGQYQSVDFHDTALHFTINAFGGWTALCVSDNNFWDINEKRMIETYKVATIKEFQDEGHLPGISEKENGYFTIYSVKQDGKMVEQKKCSPVLIENKRDIKQIGCEVQSISEIMNNI